MKKPTYVLVAVVILAAGLWLSRRQIYQSIVTSHPNEMMRNFEVVDLDGRRIQLTDYRGKVLVLDFWGTWCGACIQAFPELESIAAKYAKSQDVAFLAVNTGKGGDSLNKVRKFLETNELKIPVAYDSGGRLSSQLDIEYYPTLLVIDAGGTLRLRHIGFSSALENYAAMVEQHIEKLLHSS